MTKKIAKKQAADTITLTVGKGRRTLVVSKAGTISLPGIAGEFTVIAYRDKKNERNIKRALVVEREDKAGFAPGFWTENPDGSAKIDRRYGHPSMFLVNEPKSFLSAEEYVKVFGHVPQAEDFKKVVKRNKEHSCSSKGPEKEGKKLSTLIFSVEMALSTLKRELQDSKRFASFHEKVLLPVIKSAIEKVRLENAQKRAAKQVAMFTTEQLAALGLKRV